MAESLEVMNFRHVTEVFERTINTGIFSEYSNAGHDVWSLFFPYGEYKCNKCGQYQIDLSEDLIYGDMRECK